MVYFPIVLETFWTIFIFSALSAWHVYIFKILLAAVDDLYTHGTCAGIAVAA